MNTEIKNPRDIYQSMLHLKKHDKLRQRDIADKLEVSECEVLASRCGMNNDELGQVSRLNVDAKSRAQLFQALPSVGRVMVLTRNETVVHERKGVFDDVKMGDMMGLVLGKDIDLRLFLKQWHHGYAVTDIGERVLHSMQFFDEYGTAIQKIYATQDTDLIAFKSLIDSHQHTNQTAGVAVFEGEPDSLPSADLAQVDQLSFQAEWLAITDVHQFFLLLKKYNLTRPQAYSIAPAGHATFVQPSIMANALERAAQLALSIMVFVGNRGAIQIHSGVVQQLKRMGDWFNVLDPDFNLHIKELQIKTAWVVTRPTGEGVVTSIDFFDQHDEQVMTFFGHRLPHQPEQVAWANLVSELVQTHAVVENLEAS